MSLLPDDASFHERVQALFAHYRGHGVALSAKDVELLEQWAQAEVPFEVVARGMRIAAEQALWDAPEGRGRLESLRACKKAVDAEWKKRLKLEAGQTEQRFLEVRHQKLMTAAKKLAVRFPILSRLQPPDPAFEATERFEHLILAAIARTLPFAERRRLGGQARAQVRANSAAARRDELRFHRSALVRHELDLPRFW